MIDKCKEWTQAQGEKAKVAWGVVVVLVGLLGYNINVNVEPKNKEVEGKPKTEVKQDWKAGY